MYLTQPYFLEDTPNQILHILSTLLLWAKTFYTTISQYPTLYDFLAIAHKEISHWKYYLTYPNTCVKQKILQSPLLPPSLYSGEMSHHMHNSGESLDVYVCHTVNMTIHPYVSCMTHLSVIPNMIPPGTPSVHQYVCHQFHPLNHQLNSW